MLPSFLVIDLKSLLFLIAKEARSVFEQPCLLTAPISLSALSRALFVTILKINSLTQL